MKIMYCKIILFILFIFTATTTPPPPCSQRLTCFLQAVVSFLIPLEIEDSETGTTTNYDVVVVQGSNHREAKVISVAQAKVRDQVTFDPELAVNGTLPDALQRLQTYLDTNGRLAM